MADTSRAWVFVPIMDLRVGLHLHAPRGVSLPFLSILHVIPGRASGAATAAAIAATTTTATAATTTATTAKTSTTAAAAAATTATAATTTAK